MPVTGQAGQGDDPLCQLAKDYFPTPPTRIGIAVSGGGDSMALLHLFHRVFPGAVQAVTVDHGLRVESAKEAADVAAFCAALGISHRILKWDGPAPQGNLMDQARRARLALMADWAKAAGVGHILLGHTADDNAESFLMNLARQAGLDGLSGMRPDWQEAGIHWHRPLLAVSRAALRAYLTRNQVAWVDDPSNDNPRFTRVKARRAMGALAPLGITVETLSSTIANLADARQVMTHATAKTAAAMAERAGALCLPCETFAQLDPEIARRLLASAIQWMNGGGYAPRGSQIAQLQVRLTDGAEAQLGGVRFGQLNGSLTITREVRAVQGAVRFGQPWDHRWQVSGPVAAGVEIRALGAEGLSLCPAWRDHGPREALLVTPAVWQGEGLIAAPLAGNPGQYRAELTQRLTHFILSH